MTRGRWGSRRLWSSSVWRRAGAGRNTATSAAFRHDGRQRERLGSGANARAGADGG
jgi:hypothetical protein